MNVLRAVWCRWSGVAWARRRAVYESGGRLMLGRLLLLLLLLLGVVCEPITLSLLYEGEI